MRVTLEPKLFITAMCEIRMINAGTHNTSFRHFILVRVVFCPVFGLSVLWTDSYSRTFSSKPKMHSNAKDFIALNCWDSVFAKGDNIVDSILVLFFRWALSYKHLSNLCTCDNHHLALLP